jgi:hypothetical protein
MRGTQFGSVLGSTPLIIERKRLAGPRLIWRARALACVVVGHAKDRTTGVSPGGSASGVGVQRADHGRDLAAEGFAVWRGGGVAEHGTPEAGALCRGGGY